MEVRAAVHSHYTVICSLHSILLSTVQLSAAVNVRGFNTKWGTLTFFEATRTLSWSPKEVTCSTLTLSNWVYLKILSEDVEVRIKCFGTMLTVTGEIESNILIFLFHLAAKIAVTVGKDHDAKAIVQLNPLFVEASDYEGLWNIGFILLSSGFMKHRYSIGFWQGSIEYIYLYRFLFFPIQIEVSYRNQKVMSPADHITNAYDRHSWININRFAISERPHSEGILFMSRRISWKGCLEGRLKLTNSINLELT